MVRFVTRHPGVDTTSVDLCRFELSVVPDGSLSRKSTQLMSKCAAFLERFAGSRCAGDHWR
eukprot:9013696-Pyramimonas_sp.AAC.1